MIISRTPFRLSFMGGGTDLPSFYEEEEGAVLSTTLDKYMYLTVNDRFDSTYRLSYSRTEIQDTIAAIEHPIIRTVLQKYLPQAPRERGLELISMADIPAGTGLGSSSSFTVGLLHAVSAHLGQFKSAAELAREASHIEIEDLHEPIGKQDQYAAAFGGLQFIKFLPSGDVTVDPVITSEATFQALEASVLMFYTGVTRSASLVLAEQKSKVSQKREGLRAMRDLAYRLRDHLQQGEPLQKVGELLNEGWKIKKTMASGVSTTQIDEWYEQGCRAGAWGGKILGAGGGGFLMLLCHPDKQKQVKSALSELRPIDLKFEKWGSKIIFVG